MWNPLWRMELRKLRMATERSSTPVAVSTVDQSDSILDKLSRDPSVSILAALAVTVVRALIITWQDRRARRRRHHKGGPKPA